MTSEIDKLKHFYIEDYSGIYFTDELNDGEEFLYTTILELLKIQKPLYLKMVDLLVILV